MLRRSAERNILLRRPSQKNGLQGDLLRAEDDVLRCRHRALPLLEEVDDLLVLAEDLLEQRRNGRIGWRGRLPLLFELLQAAFDLDTPG